MTLNTSWPEFHHAGRWYEFFSGDSLQVDNTNMTFSLEPGEYRLYTNKKLFAPDTTLPVSIGEEDFISQDFAIQKLYPNPFNTTVRIELALPGTSPVDVWVYNVQGKVVYEKQIFETSPGNLTLTLSVDNLPSGVYFLRATQGSKHTTQKMVLLK